MEDRGIGNIAIGNTRVWTIAYADDIVVLAKNREALLDMMNTLGKFLKKRKLELGTEKTKMVVFNRNRKEKREVWKQKKEIIQEVQTIKYLGFIFNKDGNYKEHIKELSRKGRIATNKVWGLGERICKDDFNRRWNLFKYLVQSIISYGAEIWG